MKPKNKLVQQYTTLIDVMHRFVLYYCAMHWTQTLSVNVLTKKKIVKLP